MTPQSACLAFDVGGTSVRAAVVSPRGGRLLGAMMRLDTPNRWNRPGRPIRAIQAELVTRMADAARRLQRAHPQLRLREAGVSMAGSVTATGVVRHSSGLWGAQGHHFPLRAALARRLPLRWTVVNDMTAAAAYYGAQPRFRRYRWIAVITVSSGIGSKVFDTRRGEVLLDPEGISGELGHVRMNDASDAPRCECGVRGHIQALSSGRAAERVVRELARRSPSQFRRSRLYALAGGRVSDITTFHLATAIQRGDALARTVLGRVTEPLSQAIAVLVGTVGIERVVLIGGFALGVGRPYLDAVQRHLLRIGCYGRTASATRALICLGERGDVHGLLGAARLAQTS